MTHAGNFKAAVQIVAAMLILIAPQAAENPGDQVLVLFNKAMPQSEEVAKHYAQKRSVPAEQVVGLTLPTTEQISRSEFTEQLQKPLWDLLVEKKLFTPAESDSTDKRLKAAKIRYVALCYGVPLKIAADKKISEDQESKFPLELRRNEAAVDSELSVLPLYQAKPYLTGLIQNPLVGCTNSAMMHPTNGVLMVARLDGPNAEIAKGLVDKAIQAEQRGLWGRAYFDMRGLTNGGYELGDKWLNLAAEMTKGFGFETTVDTNPTTFPSSTPMSHIALYFGWYASIISGPFMNPAVEFVPGAIAYHLYSFSAQSIRAVDKHWVGPLLVRGITATVGYTEEPYLQFTMEVPIFTQRLMFRLFTLGEAAYAAQQYLSWQTTVIGDPLYRPFAVSSAEEHMKLIQQEGEVGDWALLTQVNRNLVMQPGTSEKVADELLLFPRTAKSSILLEKVGDLYKSRGKLKDAMDNYLAASKLPMTRGQRLRVTLAAAWLLKTYDRPQDAYNFYKQLLIDYQEYVDRKGIFEKLAPLAESFGRTEEAAEYRRLAREL